MGRTKRPLEKKIKKIYYPPLQPNQGYAILCTVDREKGLAEWRYQLTGRQKVDNERNLTMFAMKQIKMLKKSDSLWLHNSFCLNSNERCQSYQEDSALAGPRTF